MRLALLLALLLAFTGLVAGQAAYSPHDCAFNAAGQPTVTLPCSAEWVDQSMPIPTITYGYAKAALEYNVPAANGLVYVTLYFVEPNVTAINLRRFTVRVNDGLPMELDVFRLAGLKKTLQITMPPILVTNGLVRVSLKSIAGNPIISDVQVHTVNINAVKVTQWMKCEGATGDTSNCTGLSFVELRGPDGKLTRLIATSVPEGFAVTPQWTPVE